MKPTSTLIAGHTQAEYYYWYTEQDPLSAADPNYTIHVRDSPDYTDASFELTAVDTECGRVRITWIGHHENPRYMRKGIAPAVIAELGRLCGKPVISSKKYNPADPTDRRTDDADKVWRSLVDKKMAVYNQSEDRFRYVGVHPASATL